jgi:hypothetical protein
MHMQNQFNNTTMKKSTFESLPNELLLVIFRYLCSFDICQAFLDLKNARIEHLVSSIRHSLDVSSMTYDQLCQFLNDINNDTAKRFTGLIDTLVLHESPACVEFISHWKKTLNDTELLNTLLPSIKQLLIFSHDYYGSLITKPLLTSLVHHNSTLQRLHLVFETPSDTYASVLSSFICYRISVHTMILEVEQGMSKNQDN